MNLDAVVAQLKATAVPPLRLVAGAGDFASAEGLSRGVAQNPAAFVVPLDDRGSPNQFGTLATQQRIATRFGVVYAVKDLSDARGGKAAVSIDAVYKAVRDQVVGWTPAGCDEPCILERGRMVQMGDSVMWWLDEFATSYLHRKT